MIYQFVGLGLVVSLIFLEVFGLAAGGLVVPGYIALFLHQPMRVATTIAAALATTASVSILGQFMLLYGRRVLVFSVLTGFLWGSATVRLSALFSGGGTGQAASMFESIGYIIPGLLAYWMHRQGVIETLCAMLMAAFLVRLILVVAYGGQLIGLAIE